MDLISQLKQYGLIKYGNFTLKSGEKSEIYFNLKSAISHPDLMDDIAFHLSKLIEYNPNVTICGIPQGALSFATLVSKITKMPMILVRKEKKDYGLGHQIDGELFSKEVVLVEDVITTGGSVMEIINILEDHEIKIKKIVCILDREAGGVSKLIELGYDVECLVKMSDCLKNAVIPRAITVNNITQQLLDIMHHKKSNLIVSLDVDNVEKLFEMMELMGDHVCAVKIHHDIFSIIPNFVERINKVKLRKNFMVIEDRKFSDIPYICLKQLDFIQRYADIVTVHGICGEELIKGLNDRKIGLLPIHTLTVAGNLIDRVYSNRVLDMCQNYDHVVGFVSQERINNYLTFSPGIKIVKGTDDMGQCYTSITDSNADVFIVGRGIYESENVMDTLMLYKNACYEKFSI